MIKGLTPADLQRLIRATPETERAVLAYAAKAGHKHRGIATGAVLAACCDVDGRTWRRWLGGERDMPAACWRLLVEVSGVDVGGQMQAPPKETVRAPLPETESE